MNKNQPKLRSPLSIRHIRVARLITRSAASVVGLIALAADALLVALAVSASGNIPLSILLGISMIAVFCAGLLCAVWLWETYADINREACAEVAKRFESRREFGTYREQVLAMGRRFVWADLRVLDSYEVRIAEWNEQQDRERRLVADCRLLCTRFSVIDG